MVLQLSKHTFSTHAHTFDVCCNVTKQKINYVYTNLLQVKNNPLCSVLYRSDIHINYVYKNNLGALNTHTLTSVYYGKKQLQLKLVHGTQIFTYCTIMLHILKNLRNGKNY